MESTESMVMVPSLMEPWRMGMEYLMGRWKEAAMGIATPLWKLVITCKKETTLFELINEEERTIIGISQVPS